MEVLFERAALTNYFDFFLSNEDVRESKPHPEMYLTAIEKLKLQPDECLILEDNENGIKAAKASGAHLMVIHEVHDVTLENITRRISEIESES
jgi:HAD superfamily hydrolase (TIGR01509 family)